MREILFRAKRKDNGEWVGGYYVQVLPVDMPPRICKPKSVIFPKNAECNWFNKYFYRAIEVIPETVGQCTGQPDINHNLIFEGDIVKVKQSDGQGVGVIGYEHGAFMVYQRVGAIYERTLFDYWYNDWDLEVIGNIHENPELLEVQE